MSTAFTIKKKDGTMWVATQVTLTMIEGDPTGALALSYICSGIMRTCPLSEVQEVLYREAEVTGAAS